MRGLPVGVPKVMASTVGGGDVSAYVGTKDITMMPTVVDVAGINSISRRIYANAAGAIAGMVSQELPELQETKPLITASMFGNTTACVSRAQQALEAQGYEVLVFHATGTGGKTMESLIASGYITASLDITTTELADYVCGGVMSAGPERMMAAARAGIPTVLAPGCVDMCNFWGVETVPEKYHGAQPVQVEPQRHPDAHHRRGERAHGRDDRRGRQRGDGPGGDPAAAEGRLAARQPRRPLLGPRGRRAPATTPSRRTSSPASR